MHDTHCLRVLLFLLAEMRKLKIHRLEIGYFSQILSWGFKKKVSAQMYTSFPKGIEIQPSPITWILKLN